MCIHVVCGVLSLLQLSRASVQFDERLAAALVSSQQFGNSVYFCEAYRPVLIDRRSHQYDDKGRELRAFALRYYRRDGGFVHAPLADRPPSCENVRCF